MGAKSTCMGLRDRLQLLVNNHSNEGIEDTSKNKWRLLRWWGRTQQDLNYNEELRVTIIAVTFVLKVLTIFGLRVSMVSFDRVSVGISGSQVSVCRV